MDGGGTSGGGGGGTNDYTELVNKPKINSITLQGNKTSADLGLAPAVHQHAAGDITSGVLPVDRGGTGLETLGTPGQVPTVDSQGTGYEFTTPGGEGTRDYTELINKPRINSNTLQGDKTPADLGLVGHMWESKTQFDSGAQALPACTVIDLQDDAGGWVETVYMLTSVGAGATPGADTYVVLGKKEGI
jgi:hypothetical protein